MSKNIFILANYLLMPDRIGGMDRFFHRFNQKTLDHGYNLYWFFPDSIIHGFYKKFNIVLLSSKNLEDSFINYCYEQNLKCDILYIHFLELFSPNVRYFDKIAKNVIYIDHNPRPFAGNNFFRKIKKFLKYILFSKYVSNVISVSNELKNTLISETSLFFKKKIILIENGIDINGIVIREKVNTTKLKFIVSSNLRKEKGVQDILKALLMIDKSLYNEFYIHIYGEGYLKEELYDFVYSNQLESVVSFMGSSPDIYKLYACYDYLIHPSYGETFCYSVIESLFARLPVITTFRHGNVLGLVENELNGYLFDAGNILKLSEILKYIIQNKYYLQLKEYPNKLNDYTLDTTISKYINLLN